MERHIRRDVHLDALYRSHTTQKAQILTPRETCEFKALASVTEQYVGQKYQNQGDSNK